MNLFTSVVFWNRTQISPRRLRRSLAPDIFYLVFDGEREALHLEGSREGEILNARCDYAAANKFAKEFGLEPVYPERSPCVEWGRHIPRSMLTGAECKSMIAIEAALKASGLPYDKEQKTAPFSLKLAGTREHPGKTWRLEGSRTISSLRPGEQLGSCETIIRSIKQAGERHALVVAEWEEKYRAFCAE